MRRRLVPLVLILTFASLGAWSGSAGAIVCPVSARAVTPCCGPPTAAADLASACCYSSCCGSSCCASSCCPSTCCAAAAAEPACPVHQLTISTSPDPSVAGRKVTISGRLIGGGAGDTVSLWQELPGQSRFERVAQTSTNSAGDYTIVRSAGTVQTNASWYTTAAGATSATVVERVAAVVRVVSWAIAGARLTLNGHVAPSHRGERVTLQERTAEGWRTIASAVIGRRSRFTVHHRFAQKGYAVVRAVFAGDARNARSASAPVRLHVL